MQPPLRRAVLCACALILAVACDDGSRGDARMGEPCQRDRDCRSGLCVLGGTDEAPSCTRSCMRNDECPRGWSCSGVRDDGIVVCQHGAATPFGIGANE